MRRRDQQRQVDEQSRMQQEMMHGHQMEMAEEDEDEEEDPNDLDEMEMGGRDMDGDSEYERQLNNQQMDIQDENARFRSLRIKMMSNQFIKFLRMKCYRPGQSLQSL